MLGAIALALLAEGGRLPFDLPGGHLELAMIEEGAALDHGGPALALIRWSESMRLAFAVGLLGLLTISGLPTDLHVRLLALFVVVGSLVGLLAVWEVASVKARARSAFAALVAAAGIIVFGLSALAVLSMMGA